MAELAPDGETREVIAELDVPASDAETTADLLWMGETTGIEERDLPEDQRVLLRAGFESREVAERALAALPDGVRLIGWTHPDPSDLDGWAEWVEPFAIDASLLVLPTGRQPPAGHFDITVKIDAGRSFGHGAHPTTALALRSVLDLAPAAQSLLDVGAGSGILAIVGLLAGCPNATAVDIEADAAAACRSNAAANGATERLTVHHGDLDSLNSHSEEVAADSEIDQFPLVVANLEAPVLESLAPQLLRRVQPGGTLVLGGLLAERWPTLTPAFVQSQEIAMTELATPVLDGWIGPVLHRH